MPPTMAFFILETQERERQKESKQVFVRRTIIAIVVGRRFHGGSSGILYANGAGKNPLQTRNTYGGEQMKLCDMLIEAQSNIGHEGTVFLEDFDEEGNLITIVRYDEEQAAITIQDTKNRRTNFMLMDLETLEGLDHGKFKRLIDGLFYYAGPSG